MQRPCKTGWTQSGPYHNEGDAHIVTLQAGNSVYTLYEKRAWNSWCLLVAGDTVKYAVEDHTVSLLDSTGAKCKFAVVSPVAQRSAVGK